MDSPVLSHPCMPGTNPRHCGGQAFPRPLDWLAGRLLRMFMSALLKVFVEAFSCWPGLLVALASGMLPRGVSEKASSSLVYKFKEEGVSSSLNVG